MKKALIIASVASMIEQFNMNNIKLLQELGYQVDVATNFKNSGNINEKRSCELVKELQVLDVNCFQIDFDRGILSKNNIKAYKQIKRIINNNNYNLIHMHSPIGGVCGRLASKKVRKAGTRVIYTAHGFHFYKGAPLLNWIIFYPSEKYLSKYTDCLITINEEDYNLAKKKFKKCKKIELVHGVGVDEDKFNFEMSSEEKHKLRESIGLNDNDFVLIQVGELNKNKNQIMSIKAMRELVKEYPNIHLVLVGKGKLESYYNNKIEEYNLKRNIHMLGYRTDIPQLLKISNCLVATSRREGLGLNVIEGIYSRLPCIATLNRGHQEIIEDQVNGFLIKINEWDELNKKIIELIFNKELYNKFVENGNKKLNIFFINVVEKKMKEIYNN